MNRATEHKEKVAQANLIAQKQSMEAELQQVNESLSFALGELDSILEHIEHTQSELQSLLHERDEIVALNNILKIRDTSREVKLNTREAGLDVREQKLEEAERASAAKLASQEALSVVNSDSLAAQEVELAKISQDKSNELAILQSRHQTVKELEAEINTLGEKLLADRISKQSVLTELDKQIKDKRTELTQVSQQVAEEFAKIERPLQILYEGKKELAKERRDLDIYNGRVRARFRLMFPDKSMPI